MLEGSKLDDPLMAPFLRRNGCSQRKLGQNSLVKITKIYKIAISFVKIIMNLPIFFWAVLFEFALLNSF